jgi:hypothetical protein
MMAQQRRLKVVGYALGLAMALAACSSGQLNFTVEHTGLSLAPGDLEARGIGFLTPAAATGSETDKQAFAQNFAKALEKARPGVRIRGLAEVLNAINAGDLDQEYKEMYRDYLQTGILDAAGLADVGRISGVGYLAQLSLAGFGRGDRGRLSVLGLRMVDTKLGNLRIFLQIWDARVGAVVWEGSAELSYAYDTGREKPVTFAELCALAAARLYAELPGAATPAEH